MRSPDLLRFPAGQQGRAPHGVIDVRERRPDLSPDRFHGGSRPRALFRLLQIIVSTSTTTVRSSTPTAGYAIGATAALLVELPRSRAITGWARGQGPRNTAPRRSPSRLLATETSPRPRSRPDASCRGHLLLALSGVTWGERGTAVVRRACMARRREGRATTSFREEARRSPARGTFHHEIVRERTKALPGAATLTRSGADAFFTDRAPGGGTPSSDPDGSANRTGDRRTSHFVERPQRPS